MSINDWIKDKLRGSINDLLKADGDALPDTPEPDLDPDKHIGRKALLEDPYFDQVSQSVIYKHRASRLSNKTLHDVSIRDWLVSAIIQGRADTLLRLSRPQHDRFKMGFHVVKRNHNEDVSEEDLEEIANLEDFFYRCGRMDGVPADDHLVLGEFLKKTVRDALTFGHIAIEKIKTRRGGLHRFRPVPAESVYLVNKKASKKQLETALKHGKKKYVPKSDNDPKANAEVNEVDLEYYKYVQVSLDQTVLDIYGDEDMIFKLFNPQNFLDSMGYCYSPLELAIINVTNHLNTENYNANFFTHGYAARGVLHLKGSVTQSQLHAFRRQFYNNINGAQHSWKTPIIAGLDDISWVPMSGSAKDMEYINFNNHILRAICAQFQIDPIELGLDYLVSSTGRSPGQPATNAYKIEFSRERGLHPLIMFFEDVMNNDILPTLDKRLAEKYKFEFVGYEDETPQTLVAQLQAEMTVHSSMNDLLKAAQKETLDVAGADVPLNQAFWALLERNYTRGEIREKFFGDEGASKRRELQYIPQDPAFLGWQQMMMTIDRMKKQDQLMKEQMEQQQAAQQEQAKYMEAANQREQEAHAAALEDKANMAAHSVVSSNLKETAKSVGAASAPLNIGGTPVANPLNIEEIQKTEKIEDNKNKDEEKEDNKDDKN